MNNKSLLRTLQAILHSRRRQICAQLPRLQRRCFRSTIEQQTDGVYKALTEMRVRTPWIEALRQSSKIETQETKTPSEPVKPDLRPKRMSDSYFKCVWSLSRLVFLADT
jgi:acyl-coenzyme A thioesterase 9